MKSKHALLYRGLMQLLLQENISVSNRIYTFTSPLFTGAVTAD